MNRKCDWCGRSFGDSVTVDEHTVGTPAQEEVVDDIPTICTSCSEIARGKA